MSDDTTCWAALKLDERIHQDAFDLLLRRQGWHMTHCKPILTDPNVIAIRKTQHPFSLARGTGAWHNLLGNKTLRKLLRALINKERSMDELIGICGDINKLNWYLASLEAGGIVTHSGTTWKRGPEALAIDNIGPTLEWYVAEWFRLELSAPARHGVAIKEVPHGGDLDVVAFVNDIRVMVECKTTEPSNVSEKELRQFLQRAADFNPEIAVLLIDTDRPIAQLIEKLNAIYRDLARKDARSHNSLVPDEAFISAPTIELQERYKGVFWGARNIFVTHVPRDIDTSLSSVLRLYYSKVRHMPCFSGDTTLNYVELRER